MKYVKAQNVLPDEVIKIIQEYVDGEFVYIPRKNGKQKSWGENSGVKASLKERDVQIYEKSKDGAPITELAQKYYLSEQSIRRIIRQERVLLSKSLHNHL